MDTKYFSCDHDGKFFRKAIVLVISCIVDAKAEAPEDNVAESAEPEASG